MVATVGSIAVDLTVNGAKFEAGFKKSATTVERESSRMAKSVGQAQKAFTGLIGSFGGIGGIGALAGITSLSGALAKARQALADFDDIAKQSRLTGLSTDMFQALSFGALEASVSQETLNKSLEVFAKNVGLAKSGNGALVSGLKELNPELLKNIVNAKSQEERLKLVADAMNQLGSASSRAALATTVFGKGGLEMVEVLGKGAIAIDDFMKRAKELGLVISRDMLEAAGPLDDQLAIIAKAIDINLSAALVKLGPLLVKAATGALGFAQNIAAISAAVDNLVKNPSLDNFLQSLKEMRNLTYITQHVGNIIESLAVAAGKIVPARTVEDVKADIAGIEQDIVRLHETARASGDNLAILAALDDARVILSRLTEELASMQRVAEAAGKNGGDAIDRLVQSADEALHKIDAVGDEIDDLKDKTVTIRVHTVRTESGGTADVTVTSHGGVSTALPPGGGGGGSGGQRASNRLPADFYGGSASLQQAMQYDIGFASGGMIHPGDTQPVSFFKSPDEAVGVFTPAQMDAIGNAMGGVAVHYHAAPGNPDPSPRAMMELQDRIRSAVRDVMGGL